LSRFYLQVFRGRPGVRSGRALKAEPGAAGAGPAAPLCGAALISPEGKPLRYDDFRSRIWYPVLRVAGLPRIHFHDLRHACNQLAAEAGASLRELMDRMGHLTPRAAMIYLHGSNERQRAIADAISRRATSEFGPHQPKRSGSQQVRKDGRAS
jgi:integrase